MRRDVRPRNIQAKLAEAFHQLTRGLSPEEWEIEVANCIIGLSGSLSARRGPERLQEVLDCVPEVLDRDHIAHCRRRFEYQVIPADQSKPIRNGVAMLPDGLDFDDIEKIVKPHLAGANLFRIAILHEGEECDMFVDEMADMKNLPRNKRATAIYRAALTEANPKAPRSTIAKKSIRGPAVLFTSAG
jgi:hypothetical protein